MSNNSTVPFENLNMCELKKDKQMDLQMLNCTLLY